MIRQNTDEGSKNMISKSKISKKKLLGVFALVVIAAVACGASGKKKGKSSSSAPLKPLTYDPQVSLAPLVERVGPAVVNIKTTMPPQRGLSMHGPDNFFDFFFGPRGGDFQGRNRPIPKQQKAMGSGFIIDKSGLVVTNHHVVDGAGEIEVQLADDRTFKATLVGSDERTDVALLSLSKAKNLPTVSFGNSSKLRVGDRVVAIGNPFGLDHTVTSGIVSAKERVIGAGPYDDFIQTDASINPGNSGGPLFNLAGEVVGINTAIARTGQGIGFAIPSDLANGLIKSLRTDGKVVRGWLGIAFQPLSDELAKAFGASSKAGAVVANVTAGSPAEAGGLQPGDIILQVGKKKLEEAGDLPSIVASLKPGKTATFSVLRDKKKISLQVKIGTMPDDSAGGKVKKNGSGGGGAADLGFRVKPLDERTRHRLGAADVKGGVVVSEVDPSRKISEVLTPGDVIVEVNRNFIKDMDAYNRAMSSVKKGDDLLLQIYRKGAWIYKVIRL